MRRLILGSIFKECLFLLLWPPAFPDGLYQLLPSQSLEVFTVNLLGPFCLER